MNFGIYLDNLAKDKIVDQAIEATTQALTSGYKDSSIFYKVYGVLSQQPKCGLFNSTELCYFNGVLVVTFLDGIRTALKEINNRELYFYYGFEQEKNLFGYLQVLSDKNVKILSPKEHLDFVKRKLNRSDVITCDNLHNVVEVINEQK